TTRWGWRPSPRAAPAAVRRRPRRPRRPGAAPGAPEAVRRRGRWGARRALRQWRRARGLRRSRELTGVAIDLTHCLQKWALTWGSVSCHSIVHTNPADAPRPFGRGVEHA